jgi:hypothetical protein
MFQLTIDTDNSAFEEWGVEVSRILGEVALRVAVGELEGSIHDINGNRVGKWRKTK